VNHRALSGCCHRKKGNGGGFLGGEKEWCPRKARTSAKICITVGKKRGVGKKRKERGVVWLGGEMLRKGAEIISVVECSVIQKGGEILKLKKGGDSGENLGAQKMDNSVKPHLRT